MNATKRMSAMAGSLLLAGSGALALIPALQSPAYGIDGETAALAEATTSARAKAPDAAPIAAGIFSYTQDALTPADTMKAVFNVAASAVCASLPNYQAIAGPIDVRVNGTQAMTLEPSADEDALRAYTPMACSCASNKAGGGAVANVEAGGIALADVLAQINIAV